MKIPQVDPTVRPELAAAIGAMPSSKLLGITVRGFAPGGISVLEMAISPSHTFDGRTAQGGIVGVLADYAGVSAAFSALEPEYSVATASFEVHNLSPVRAKHLVAVGHLMRAGRHSSVSHVEVYSVAESGSMDPGELVCIATTTAAILGPVTPSTPSFRQAN